MLLKDLEQQIAKQHYANIELEISDDFIGKAIDSFMQFLELPDDTKSRIYMNIAKKHRRGDVGFKHRDSGEDIYSDSKDFFHFHPAVFREYDDFIKSEPVVNEFLQNANIIWQEVYARLQEVFRAFEEKYPGTYEKIFDSKQPHLLLRFLRYNWQNSGKHLAKPHFDAGSFTMAISESCSGLRIGSCPDDMQSIKHKEGHAIFMLSSNYEKILGKTDLKPGWHDVVQMDETKIGNEFARWAVVAFIDGHDVEALPREETHKYVVG